MNDEYQPPLPREPGPRRFDVLPVLLLALLAAAMLGGLWLFPRLQAYIAHEDCIAVGRTDCG
jgi:hypothetical protein